jgi:hypothetical protein
MSEVVDPITEARLTIDERVCALLEAGESPEGVREFVEEVIANWQDEQE